MLPHVEVELHVDGETTGLGEGLVAELAHERPLARVLAQVIHEACLRVVFLTKVAETGLGVKHAREVRIDVLSQLPVAGELFCTHVARVLLLLGGLRRALVRREQLLSREYLVATAAAVTGFGVRRQRHLQVVVYRERCLGGGLAFLTVLVRAMLEQRRFTREFRIANEATPLVLAVGGRPLRRAA